MFWRFWPKKLTFNRHTKRGWCLTSHCNGLGLRSWPHVLIDAPNAGVGLSSRLVKLLVRACTRLVLVLIIKVLALVIHTHPTGISDTFWSPINICLQTIKTIITTLSKGLIPYNWSPFEIYLWTPQSSPLTHIKDVWFVYFTLPHAFQWIPMDFHQTQPIPTDSLDSLSDFQWNPLDLTKFHCLSGPSPVKVWWSDFKAENHRTGQSGQSGGLPLDFCWTSNGFIGKKEEK